MLELSKKRLFIAINLPQNVKEALNDLVDKLKSKYGQIRWVKPTGLHLTLHFLGYLNQQQEEKVKLVMQSLAGKFGEFQFKLGKIGAFPNLSNPRVIFINCDQINGRAVFKLQELLGQKLEELGLQIDNRPWKSHITLGRAKEKINFKIPPDLDSNIAGIIFKVSSFELMESELKISGAEYRELANYKL